LLGKSADEAAEAGAAAGKTPDVTNLSTAFGEIGGTRRAEQVFSATGSPQVAGTAGHVARGAKPSGADFPRHGGAVEEELKFTFSKKGVTSRSARWAEKESLRHSINRQMKGGPVPIRRWTIINPNTKSVLRGPVPRK
jgi:hypothetical protein